MEREELLRIRVPLATIRKLEAGTLDPPISKKIVRTLIARDFWLAKESDKAQGYKP
jgi:hypothetical protein